MHPMKSTVRLRFLRPCALALGLCAASPAWAQWSPVVEVPATDVFSVWANGDTVVAGADTAVYVSTNAGATWQQSTKPVAGVTTIKGLWVRNGKLYAGTYGQGVFVSPDLGTTWSGFNQGLVGGLFNSQLFIQDLVVRRDSMYAATAGAGAWVRNLAGGTWSHFGNVFEPNSASNMSSIGASETRLLAAAGGNGMVFFRDGGDADWTRQWLNNANAVPGLSAQAAVWTGHGWVVGSNGGVFISPDGQQPWTPSGPNFGTVFLMSLALRGRDVFASYGVGMGTVIAFSADDGVTWQELETLDQTFTYRIAVRGNELYAGRFDGLWRRSLETVAVPADPAPAPLKFALAGGQPITDQARFRFELPAPGPIAIDVFDVAGRRVGASIRGWRPAGPHETTWDARGLAPGVYLARLTAGAQSAVIRVIRVR
jgi:photosystem II stability/assembly factor-like uncharacterized protein